MPRQMRYYYLDKEHKPQGPYTVDELNSFLKSGLISEDTLIANAGESTWKSLSSVFSETEEVKCSTWNNHETNCPHCQAILRSDNISSVCPECGKSMYCPKRGLWGTFIYVIRNAFNFRGRAGRREFWLFYLVYYLIYLLLSEIARYYTAEQTRVYELNVENTGDSFLPVIECIRNYFSDTVVIASLSIVSLYCLLMLMPFLSVSVRRLHDIGISAAPVIFGCISYALVAICLIGSLLMSFFLFDIISFTHDINMQTAIIALIMMLVFVISAIFFFIISIFMVVCMFIPGHPGSNKYGPAPSIK